MGNQVRLKFSISQHSRDLELINSFIAYLGCGRVKYNGKMVEFEVTKCGDLGEKIIPLFVKYPLVGIKHLNFIDFCKAWDIMKVKGHLTKDGFEEISKIKSGMNKLRHL